MIALKNLFFKVLLICALLCPSFTYAQVWQNLSAREQDLTSFEYTHVHNMAISPAGVPYIIFQDDLTEDKGIVKKFVNGKWEKVGTGYVAEDYSTDMNLAFSPDGSIYAVYQCVIEGSSSRVNIKKLINNIWVSLGRAGIGADLSPSLTFTPDGTPYVAFSSNVFNFGGVQVRKFENGKWNPVGTTGNTPISLKSASSNKLICYKNEFYLAYSDDNKAKKITVKKLVNNIWSILGEEGFSTGAATSIDMTFSKDGILHVIYQDSGIGNKISVKKFENNTWSDVGNVGFAHGASKTPNINFTKNNTPIIFYTDESLANKAIFGKLVNGTWALTEVTPNTTVDIVLNTRMRLDDADNIYVSYSDQASKYGLTVKQLVADKWVGVGISGISPEGTSDVRIKTDQNNIPYVAYIDINDQYKASVKKYVNGAWQLVGNPSFTTFNTKYIDLAIGSNNIPYLIFRDDGWNVNVMKFDGTSWVKVGSTLTLYQSYNLKIVVGNDNVPYVAYSDAGVNSKVIVRKFNGTAWVQVGDYLTPAPGGDISMRVAKSGILYVAYTYSPDGRKNVTLKKFNGTAWENVGAVSFTNSTNVTGVSLALADDETPYVSYCDGANGIRARVKKLVSGVWTDVGGFVSAGMSNPTSITLTKNGEPVVAFQDSQNNWISSVSVFKNGVWAPLASIPLSYIPSVTAELTTDRNGDVYVVYAVPQALVAKLGTGTEFPPVIYEFTPNATEGRKVTIIGDNFTNATEVKFGSTPAASFTVISPKEILAEVGNGTSGIVSVKTAKGEATKSGFIFTPHPPVITSISPLRSTINSTVQIIGKYFSTNKDDNIVYFGPVKATVIAATATTLQVNVPAYSAYNMVTVTVNNLIAYSPFPFNLKPVKTATTIDAGTFEPKNDFATGHRPQMVKLGDIDGDGKVDVILTFSENDFFYVYQNQSTGAKVSFASPVKIANGFSPNALTIADLDMDGKLDVLVAKSGNISFYKNTSTKDNISFAPALDYGNYSYPFSTAAADLDLDGRADLICTAINQPWGVFVTRNVATDNSYLFVENQMVLADASIPNSVIAGDLNNDGYPDLISNEMDGIYLYQNASSPGKLAFNMIGDGLRVADYLASEPYLADMDGDGKLDILTTNGTVNQFAVYKNQSTLAAVSFTGRKVFTTPNNPGYLTVADFDGDGLPDVAMVNRGTQIFVLRNTSTLGDIQVAPAVNFDVGKLSTYVTAGDINGDGFADLVVTSNNDDVFSVLLNTNGKTTLPASNYSIAIQAATCVGNANGAIKIVGTMDINYVAEITIGAVKTDYAFKKEINIENLKAGTYTINVYPKDLYSDVRNYTAVISEPKALSVYSSVEPEKGILNLTLRGSDRYYIMLNGKEYVTVQSTISLPLSVGSNDLQVSTALTCQGTFSKLITYGGTIKLYPNPVDRILTISLNQPNAKMVSVSIFSPVGTTALKKQFANVYGGLELDVSTLNPGIYILKLNIDGVEVQHKIIKK